MPNKKTGFINYRSAPPDPRLLALQAVWESLRRDGRLPVYGADTIAAFQRAGIEGAADHASLIEIREENRKRRYFVVFEGPAAVAAVGLDGSGTYLDAADDTPEFSTILTSDYDGVVATRRPRFYAEEHHLDGLRRNIQGIQLPFAADGASVDTILEFVYPMGA